MAFGDLLTAPDVRPGDFEVRGVLISAARGRSPLTVMGAGRAFGLTGPHTTDRHHLDTTDGPVLAAVTPALHRLGFTVVEAQAHGGTTDPVDLVHDLMEVTVVPIQVGWVGYGWPEPVWRWATPVTPTLVDDWGHDAQLNGRTLWRLEWEAADITVHPLAP